MDSRKPGLPATVATGSDHKPAATPATACLSTTQLAALAEGRLHGARRERAQGHLAACDGCRAGLQRLEAARATLRAVAEWTPPAAPAAGSARLEATLRWNRLDGGTTGPRPRLRGAFLALPSLRPVWAAAAAAAILLVGGTGYALLRHRLGASSAPAAPIEVARKPAPAPGPAVPAPPEASEAAITLLGGDVRLVAADGSEAPLDPRRLLHEGDRVRTGAGARLAFQWGEGSGALLESDGELRLERLQPRSQDLAIARGRIAVRVGPHQPGESLRVRSPDHDVTVHGTWFVVGVQPRGTDVEVLEGVVEVSAPSGDAASTRLPAPSRASFQRGSGVAQGERALTGREAQALRQRSEMGLLAWSGVGALLDGFGVLRITSDPPSQLVVDGVSFGPSPLELRRPHGRHLVELSRAGFTTVRKWISVGDAPAALETALAPEVDRPAAGPSPGEEFAQLVSARNAYIQRCYERSAKRNPQLAGTLTLTVRVGSAGQVLGSRVSDDTLRDEDLSECIKREAKGWLFHSARNAVVRTALVLRPRGLP